MIPAPPAPEGTERSPLSGRSHDVFSSLSFSSGSRIGAEAQFTAVAPHAMRNDREIPGRGDPGAGRQAVRRLVEGRACKLIAAAADASLTVRPAGLISRGRQSRMRPRIPGPGEACGIVNSGAETEGGNRPRARHAREPAADGVRARARASLRSVLFGIARMAASARRVSMHGAANPPARSPS